MAHSRPEVLRVLREQAIIQSSESSNRIEGVTVSPERLRPLVIGKSKPRDRSEEELAGYRKALEWVFSRQRKVPVTPNLARKLHAIARGGTTGDAGEWKRKNNEMEVTPTGERRVRFVPTAVPETPAAMEHLCLSYAEHVKTETFRPCLSFRPSYSIFSASILSAMAMGGPQGC